jgi:hypothetical protein
MPPDNSALLKARAALRGWCFTLLFAPHCSHAFDFTDATSGDPFMISAWPYTQLDLTLGREGRPSATWDQPAHLEIVDVVRDDLFTVLFKKNGARYIVVTMPELERWLIEILKTWEFAE